MPLMAGCTTVCDKVCQWLVTGQWFSLATRVSSTNKTEILLKVVLNTIKPNQTILLWLVKHALSTITIVGLSEWLLISQASYFSTTSWPEQVTFWWHDGDVCFVLEEKQAYISYSASSQNQQSNSRNITPLLHIILIQIQPAFVLILYATYSGEAAWFNRGSIHNIVVGNIINH